MFKALRRYLHDRMGWHDWQYGQYLYRGKVHHYRHCDICDIIQDLH